MISLISVIKDRAIKDTQFQMISQQLTQMVQEIKIKLSSFETAQIAVLVDIGKLQTKVENSARRLSQKLDTKE